MTQRTERIDELLRQEIGQALEREVTDPGLGFVTVTEVETSPDLSFAKVWVSVIGPAEQRKESLAALRRATPFIRHGLGAKLRLRRIPELDFRLDDSVERGTRVMHILDELEAGRTPVDDGTAGESLPVPVPRVRQSGDADDPQEAPATPGQARKKRTARPKGDRAAGAALRKPRVGKPRPGKAR
jgi:ribosome-binding factor A